MLDNFEDLARDEFIQYICLCIHNFYCMFDYFTENEKNYINDFIKKMDEVYNL